MAHIRRPRKAGLLLLTGCLLLLAACGSLQVPEFELDSLAPLNAPDLPQASPNRTPIPSPELVLALDPAVTEWLDRHVGRSGSPGRRARRLLEALFTEEGRGIGYRYSGTMTASETFHASSGNCLSISNLVVAAARHLGLPADFQEVSVEFNWKRVGNLFFMDRHINVRIFRVGHGLDMEVDMLPQPSARSRRTVVLGDATAIAHFYNNRAGEALAGGDPRQALRYFRRALESDAELAFVWANLGTLYGRYEQFDEAERVLDRALALNPEEYVALNNLTEIYRHTGREARAREYEARVAKIRARNPYHLADLAERDFRGRDYQGALEKIGRSLELNDREYRFHLLAARVHLRLENPERSSWHLEQARRLAPEGEELPRDTSELLSAL